MLWRIERVHNRHQALEAVERVRRDLARFIERTCGGSVPTGGHVLRVRLGHGDLDVVVECRDPEGAACRVVVTGECVAASFIELTGVVKACDGEEDTPLWDGMPIEVEWREDFCADNWVWRPTREATQIER